VIPPRVSKTQTSAVICSHQATLRSFGRWTKPGPGDSIFNISRSMSLALSDEMMTGLLPGSRHFVDRDTGHTGSDRLDQEDPLMAHMLRPMRGLQKLTMSFGVQF
jgi:hypothetical protein